MLIVSDFHDYYDTISAYGVDKTVVYQRKAEARKIEKDGPGLKPVGRMPKHYSRISFPSESKANGMHMAEMRVIGFCGKLYPCLEIQRDHRDRIIAHDAESAIRALKGAFFRVSTDNGWWRPELLSEGGLKYFFNPETYEAFLPFFEKEKVPIFIAGHELQPGANHDQIILNPMLRTYGFERIKPLPGAFQEIYHYISGVLGTPAPPTVVIDDKHKAIAHGHDGKYSFRKPPGGGRWR